MVKLRDLQRMRHHTQNPPGFDPWGSTPPWRQHLCGKPARNIHQCIAFLVCPFQPDVTLQRRKLVLFLFFFLFQESSLQELPCQVAAAYAKRDG